MTGELVVIGELESSQVWFHRNPGGIPLITVNQGTMEPNGHSQQRLAGCGSAYWFPGVVTAFRAQSVHEWEARINKRQLTVPRYSRASPS